MKKEKQKNILLEIMDADEKNGLYKQLTAIQWLRIRLKEIYEKEGKLPLAYVFHLIKQAEDMQDKQILEAFEAGVNNREDDLIPNRSVSYYIKTYGISDNEKKSK